MPGLVPASTFFVPRGYAWMAGTSPAMTPCRTWEEARKAYCFCNFVSVPVPLLSVAE
ncbi:hypothetical protein ABIC03_007523 [Bradyrhizobium sp. RT6a]|jgi:hypothetical protein